MFGVIMAGGRGTRFWPSSRKNNPKQLLDIIGPDSMLQMTIDRLKKISSLEDIFIVTSRELAPKIRKRVKGVNKKNIIVEPNGKNTAPAIALAALHIKKIRKDAVMAIFPSDHLIIGAKQFLKTLRSSFRVANKKDALVTIGIKPTYPSTGYGYIQYNKKEPLLKLNVFKVKAFAEKPHLTLAKRFLKSGDFLWNGGMFVWKADVFLEEMKKHMPDLNEIMQKIDLRIQQRKHFNDIWDSIEPVSIDYGLLEKSNSIYAVEADFKWNDLGSWSSIYNVSTKTKDKNVVRGKGVVIDGTNNLIESKKQFTALVGVSDMAVIATSDAILVVPKDKAEQVKDVVDYLEKHNKDELL